MGKQGLPFGVKWCAALGMLLLALALPSCGGGVGSSATGQGGQGAAPARTATHVFVVVEENKAFDEVIGNASAPFLNSLGQQFAIGTQYFANGTDSLPNYFMLTAGELVGDNSFTGVVSDDNVVRELTAAGKTWKVYADALPSPGYMGPSEGPYIRTHNPFVFFSDVVSSPAQQANVVPFGQFAADLANNTLPDYVFIVPDNFDNSHDCPDGSNNCTLDQTLAHADQWLQNNVGPLINSSMFQQGGLLIVVFDESEESDMQFGGGHVPLIIAGANVKRGFVSNTFFQHPSVLRLTLKVLGVGTFPGASATAPDMDEFFQ